MVGAGVGDSAVRGRGRRGRRFLRGRRGARGGGSVPRPGVPLVQLGNRQRERGELAKLPVRDVVRERSRRQLAADPGLDSARGDRVHVSRSRSVREALEHACAGLLARVPRGRDRARRPGSGIGAATAGVRSHSRRRRWHGCRERSGRARARGRARTEEEATHPITADRRMPVIVTRLAHAWKWPPGRPVLGASRGGPAHGLRSSCDPLPPLRMPTAPLPPSTVRPGDPRRSPERRSPRRRARPLPPRARSRPLPHPRAGGAGLRALPRVGDRGPEGRRPRRRAHRYSRDRGLRLRAPRAARLEHAPRGARGATSRRAGNRSRGARKIGVGGGAGPRDVPPTRGARGTARRVLHTAVQNSASAQSLFEKTGFRKTMIEMTRERETGEDSPEHAT